jgi:uncharacterized protein YlbG (UPF0298 family)
MERYKFIQKLKTELKIGSIQYGNVLAIDLYARNIKYFIKILLESIFYTYNFTFTPGKKNILIQYSYKDLGRKDYDYIINKLNSIEEDADNLVIYKVMKINLLSVLSNIVLSVKFFSLLNYKKDYCLIDKIKISLLLVKYTKLEKKITNFLKDKKYNLVITFCDAHGVDNLFTQICNNKSIITATLQHGQYRILKTGKETPDAEAYMNFISNYLLAWGKATAEEFIKAGISEDRIKVLGALKPFSYYESIELNETKLFGVILNGDTYYESNLKMLEIAEKFATHTSKKYIIRLHPKNKKKLYKKYLESQNVKEVVKNIEGIKYIKKVEFSILHMTGVYVEMLSLRAPFFVLDDMYTEDLFKSTKLTFCNLEELNIHYKDFLKNRHYILENISVNYHYFNDSENIEQNYKNFIKECLDN